MEFSLRHKQSCVKSQLDRPTCVAFATSAFHEYQVEVCGAQKENCNLDLSEEFLYYFCKETDGRRACGGTTLAAASAVLKTHGQCAEHFLPYNTISIKGPSPSAAAIGDAAMRIYGTLSLLDVRRKELEKALSIGSPTIVVAEWYSNSYRAAEGRIAMPTAADRHLGRHAVLIVGVNDVDSEGYRIWFKNSWGPKWGDHGFGSFGLNYFSAYCTELWG
jgi:C1A family cysteine protease